jgi:hypothetical protein
VWGVCVGCVCVDVVSVGCVCGMGCVCMYACMYVFVCVGGGRGEEGRVHSEDRKEVRER